MLYVDYDDGLKTINFIIHDNTKKKKKLRTYRNVCIKFIFYSFE